MTGRTRKIYSYIIESGESKYGRKIVADELANDFSEIGMMYAKELLENEWITQEQYTIAKTIDEMLVNMSKRKELWSEEALFNAEEWDECRKKGNLLLKMIE